MSSDRALRILLVSHGLPPHSVGGVEQHVEGLARALLAGGHSVHVFTRSGEPDVEQGTVVHGSEAITAPGGRRAPVTRVVYRYEGLETLESLYRCERIDRALSGFLADHAFDVAHVHHLTGLSTGVFGVLRAAGIPALLTLHDYWLVCPRGQMWHRDGSVCDRVEPARCAGCLQPTFPGWVPATGGEPVLETLHAHALATLLEPAALIVPSARAIAPFVAAGVPADRFQVVENGVDTESLGRLAPPRVEQDRPLRVGFLGTLIPSKGLAVLVDAVQRLAPGTVELRIHGNAVPYHGDETYLTRVFARLRPGDAVSYAGPYHTSDLAAILGGLDLVVAPALWREAFGLTVREALAAARPVVVSRIGGLQDAIEDGVAGRLVEPGDAGALAAVLAELAADRAKLAGMVRACRERHAPRGFHEMSAELVRTYRAVLDA